MNSLFGYDPQDTWLHRLTGATKMLAFIGISVIVMASYDTRFVCAVMLASIILFAQAKIHWRQISLVVKIITIFAVVNLLLVFVFFATVWRWLVWQQARFAQCWLLHDYTRAIIL